RQEIPGTKLLQESKHTRPRVGLSNSAFPNWEKLADGRSQTWSSLRYVPPLCIAVVRGFRRSRTQASAKAGLRNAHSSCKIITVPELPDIAAYIPALEPRIVGQPLERVRLASPFVLRTVEPPLAEVGGLAVRELRRVGKRIAIGMENDL